MNLINMLPSFYHNSDFVKSYMSSQSVEHNFIKESIDDLVNNLYVNTATWGLDYFEEELSVTAKFKFRARMILRMVENSGEHCPESVR